MWGAITGAALGLGTGIVSGIQQKNTSKKQKELIDNEKKRAEDLFNDQYYTNYNDTVEARSAMQNIKNMYKDANKTTTLLGDNVTDEAKIARQANQDMAIAETANNMAALGTQRKDNLMANYQNKLDNFSAMDMSRLQDDANRWAGIAGAGQQLGSDIFKSSDLEKGKW